MSDHSEARLRTIVMWAPVRHQMPVTDGLARCLCGLLRQAVADARALSHDPRYKLLMTTWHHPDSLTGKCLICMAGAVMARRLQILPTETATVRMNEGLLRQPVGSALPRRAGSGKAFLAIDSMRKGHFVGAVRFFYLGASYEPLDELLPVLDKAASCVLGGFSTDAQRAPWQAYLRAADILEKAGL